MRSRSRLVLRLPWVRPGIRRISRLAWAPSILPRAPTSTPAPRVNFAATTDGAAYGYFGFGFDVNFGPSWVLTPNAAAGVFEPGSGTRLGSWWEFRTGAEFAYRFPNQTRLG